MVGIMIELYITTKPFTSNETEKLIYTISSFIKEFSIFKLPLFVITTMDDGSAKITIQYNTHINTNEECWLTCSNISEILFYAFIQESFPAHISMAYDCDDDTCTQSGSEFTWKNLSLLESNNEYKEFITAITLALKTNSRNSIVLNADLVSDTIKSFYF